MTGPDAWQRRVLAAGALGMLSGVALGAFGAHALKGRLSPEAMAVFHTGIEYQFYHSLGLLALGLVPQQGRPGRPLAWAARLMGAGIVLFSGSLYALALTGVHLWGALAPAGGAAWLAAWALVLFACLRRRPGAGGRSVG
jgi:uncharacterized membrane protein YgdD (TMEM256/DUF423 family)